MRVMRPILATLILAILPTKVLAHGCRDFHYNDVARILNGFGKTEYKDAMRSVRTVAANKFSPNAAQSTIESEKAFAGFTELFNQVSCKMDSMPHEVEILFGLPPRKLQNAQMHRLLCHGWALDADPPEHIIALLQKSFGIDKTKLLNYWRHYQLETFAMAEKYTGLPTPKAKAFAGLIWDIHLLGDWTPDNWEVSRLVPIKSLSDDFAKNMKVLLGDGRRTDYVCKKIKGFVESRIAKGMPTRHVASEFMEWLPNQKFGTEIFKANKNEMKTLWNHAVAENINKENATIRIQGRIAEAGAAKEAKHLARDAKLKNTTGVPKPTEEVRPLKVARDLKAQCKDAKLAKGFIPETMKPQKGYLVPITYKSGRKSYVLLLKSSAVKAGTGAAVNAGTAVASGAVAGAAEGVCAFVISSGIAFGMYQYGAIDDEELKEEFAKAAMSAAVVGTIVAVTVILGASPYGFTVIAVGIAGYVVCDMVFTMIKQQTFTCDDILGYMDEEFEDTASFFTIGTQPSDTFINKKGKDSFVDEPELPTYIDLGSKGKSFIDFLEK